MSIEKGRKELKIAVGGEGSEDKGPLIRKDPTDDKDPSDGSKKPYFKKPHKGA